MNEAPRTPPARPAEGIAAAILAGGFIAVLVWCGGQFWIVSGWWEPSNAMNASVTAILDHIPPLIHQLGLPWTIGRIAPIWQWPPPLAHAVTEVLLVSGVCGAVAALIAGLYAGAAPPAERQVGGRRLIESPKRYARSLRRREGADGVRLHPLIPISRMRERAHLLAVGGSGSGKSQVVHRLIRSSADRGDRQMIYDFKGDLTANYYHPETSILLAPWDTRGTAWDIATDVPDIAAARELAAAIVTEPSSGDPMWASGARQILVGLIVSLQARPTGWSIADLSAICKSDVETIAAILREYHPEAAALLAQPESRTAASYMSTLTAYLAPIHDLARAWPARGSTHGFSVRRWLTGADTTSRVIFQHNEANGELARMLFRMVLRVVLQLIASPAFERASAPTWLFLDEFLQAGKIGPIQSIAETARSKDIRLVLTAQGFTRIQDVYGREAANGLAETIGTVLIGRSRGETAEWASKLAGNRQLDRYRASTGQGSGSTHWDRTSEPLMRPEAFDARLGTFGRGRQLQNRLLVLAGGDDVGLITWPLLRIPQIAAAHVPHDVAEPAVESAEPSATHSNSSQSDSDVPSSESGTADAAAGNVSGRAEHDMNAGDASEDAAEQSRVERLRAVARDRSQPEPE